MDEEAGGEEAGEAEGTSPASVGLHHGRAAGAGVSIK